MGGGTKKKVVCDMDRVLFYYSGQESRHVMLMRDTFIVTASTLSLLMCDTRRAFFLFSGGRWDPMQPRFHLYLCARTVCKSWVRSHHRLQKEV